jgi:hypothetical protein
MLLSDKTQTKNKDVIQCPVCQEKGIVQNLARIKDGKIIILRFEKKEFDKLQKESTIVQADKFKLYCGRCGSLVLKND